MKLICFFAGMTIFSSHAAHAETKDLTAAAPGIWKTDGIFPEHLPEKFKVVLYIDIDLKLHKCVEFEARANRGICKTNRPAKKLRLQKLWDSSGIRLWPNLLTSYELMEYGPMNKRYMLLTKSIGGQDISRYRKDTEITEIQLIELPAR